MHLLRGHWRACCRQRSTRLGRWLAMNCSTDGTARSVLLDRRKTLQVLSTRQVGRAKRVFRFPKQSRQNLLYYRKLSSVTGCLLSSIPRPCIGLISNGCCPINILYDMGVQLFIWQSATPGSRIARGTVTSRTPNRLNGCVILVVYT